MKESLRAYLFTSFVGDLILPIYSLFIPLLASESGATAAEVGIVGGASYVTYSFVPFLAGRYSDKIKVRHGFMLAALGVLSLMSLLYVFAANPLQLIATRIGEGAGWAMLWPTVQAAIAEDTQREPSKSLSIYNTIWSGASAVGPLLGVGLIFFTQSIRTIFMLSVALLLAVIVVNLLLVKRRPNPTSKQTNRGTEPLHGNYLADGGGAPYRIWFYMLALAFVMAVRGVLFTFALPLAQSTGVPVLLIGSVAVFFGASRFATYVLTMRDEIRGWLMATRNIKRNVITGVIIASFGGVLPVIPDKSGATFLASFIIVGVGASMVTAISQTEMLRKDASRRGEMAGLQESSIGAGVALGPIVSGLASGGSLFVPFFFPISGIVVVLPTLLLGTRRRSTKQLRPTAT